MKKNLILAAAAALLGGCGMALNPQYKPGPLPTAWEGRKPRIFLGTVSDKSSGSLVTGSPDRHSATLSRPAEEILRDALTTEFARLGVPLVKTIAESDAQISAAWKELTVQLQPGIAVLDHAVIKISLQVKSPDNAILYNDDVAARGIGQTHHLGCCPGGGPGEAVDDALAKVMEATGDLFRGEIAEQIFLAKSRGAGLSQVPAAPAAVRSDVDAVPSGKAARRRGHAVVIGVERYRQQLPNADFAASDARLVGKYLTQAMGFPEENVAVLTNDGATRGDLEKYLEQWLHNRVEPGDSVFVYYSGHGSPNPATGDAYIVPFDGDPMYLEQTAYPLQKLYAALARLPTKKVTVVLDSCFSGAGGRSVIAKGARPLVAGMAKTNIPEELTVLSAAAGNQISQSYQDKGHGLFTYFFLKGLSKQAAAGSMDMKKVFDYAAPEVSRVARKDFNTEQVPQWHGAGL